MSSTQDQAETVAFLSDPRSYRGAAERVETITTHASVVFLVGERAYKLKRAVRYSYLDYATVELRRRACEAELMLNRRTAPSLYLCVLPIVRRADGSLSLDGPGTPVDWVVVMRQFPQEALFSHLADHGHLTPALVMQTADRIAAFHAIAEPLREQGGAAGIGAVVAINDENLRKALPRGLTIVEVDRLHETTLVALRRNVDLLDRRRDAGKVRRCHGDLHLNNICMFDGAPTLFDCIEFSDLIAGIDVLYDLAFLLMDLRHRGLKEQAALICNRYLDRADEVDGLAAMPLFLSLRAAVRAHVTATGARSLPPDDRARKLDEARAYFNLAEDMLRPATPRLVAIGGLSGTGKSSLAAAIAGDLGPTPGARVLRSDVLRKRLFGLAPESRLPEAAYAPGVTAQVYETLEREAERVIATGYSVIIDAVAAKPEERAALAAIAARTGIAFTGLWLEAVPELLLARLAQRKGDASDADAAVLRRQLAYDLGPMTWRRVDAALTAAAVHGEVRRILELPA